MVNRRQAVLLLALAVIAVLSVKAFAQGRAATPGARAPETSAVATVGPRSITRAEWERRCALALAEFEKRNSQSGLSTEVRDLVRRQVLESEIRIEMLVLEAKRLGMTATPAEAESALKGDPFFNPGGRFDAARFEAARTTQPAAFQSAIATAREQIAARRLNDRIMERYRPPDDRLKRRAERELRHATVDVLGLAEGDFDGSYAEPREQDVIHWYHAHTDEYRREDRASLTVAFVNSPGLSDSIRNLPGGAQAWSRRMKAMADSILVEVAHGKSLEQAAGFLGPRSGTIVTPDNFPGYWRAGADVNRRIFQVSSRGKVIPEALPATEGWLVVRVDDIVPAHVAPLREVSKEIRRQLRADRKLHHEEYEERALYATIRDSLAAPAWQFRVAMFDTGNVKLPEPGPSDLDRYYRGHLADYSSFDAKTGAIVSRPFDEVRDEIRSRWFADRRRIEVRIAADELLRAWASGKQDAKEEERLGARDLPPAIHGSAVEVGDATAALTDTVWSYADPKGPGMVPTGSGWIVWKTVGRMDRAVPTFEQARPLLARRVAAAKAAAEVAGARALFAQDAGRFSGGKVIYYSRFGIPAQNPMDVQLTRAEVERYQKEHLDRYSAPELVTARHILIAPGNSSPEADRAARKRAEEILRRAKAGEDFAALAKQYSDDPATKDKGGDLGTFGRGTMMAPFEQAVFALKPGEFAPEPVRTTLGWHVVYCVDHVPAVVHRLDWIYMIVGGDAARDKARREAGARADSFVRVLRSVDAAKAVAKKYGYVLQSFQKPLGESSVNSPIAEYYKSIDEARPGQFVPRADGMPGNTYWVTWIDSIGPPRAPDWDQAKKSALESYRRGAGRRALEAKRAELDSLAAQGWSLDSLGALWGGLERQDNLVAGRGLPGLGGASVLDSLVFGTADAAPVLSVGQESGWVDLAQGIARIRLVDRQEPAREQLLARMAADRNAAIERGLVGYFAGLEHRWPVHILDAKMRATSPVEPAPARRR